MVGIDEVLELVEEELFVDELVAATGFWQEARATTTAAQPTARVIFAVKRVRLKAAR